MHPDDLDFEYGGVSHDMISQHSTSTLPLNYHSNPKSSAKSSAESSAENSAKAAVEVIELLSVYP